MAHAEAAVHQRPEGEGKAQRGDGSGRAPEETTRQGVGQRDGESAKGRGKEMGAQHVEAQYGDKAGVQVMVKGFVARRTGEVEGKAALQELPG